MTRLSKQEKDRLKIMGENFKRDTALISSKVLNKFKVEKTKNYNFFGFFKEENREILPYQSHLKDIMSSVYQWGGNVEPIICDKQGNIIEGQRRTKACIALDLSISYIVLNVDREQSLQLMKSLNTTKKPWCNKDFLRFYQKTGTYNQKQNYKRLGKLKTQYKLSFYTLFEHMYFLSNKKESFDYFEAKRVTESRKIGQDFITGKLNLNSEMYDKLNTYFKSIILDSAKDKYVRSVISKRPHLITLHAIKMKNPKIKLDKVLKAYINRGKFAPNTGGKEIIMRSLIDSYNKEYRQNAEYTINI